MNWFEELLIELWYGDKHLSMPEQLIVPPTPLPDPDALAPWDTFENRRHNVRALCDLCGLSEAQKNSLSATVHCESDYDPSCVHPNYVTQPNGESVLSSTDFGIAAINDFWHIGEGKDFPSSEYVLANPEACIRWMCKMWLAGDAKLWVCYLRGMSNSYTS